MKTQILRHTIPVPRPPSMFDHDYKFELDCSKINLFDRSYYPDEAIEFAHVSVVRVERPLRWWHRLCNFLGVAKFGSVKTYHLDSRNSNFDTIDGKVDTFQLHLPRFGIEVYGSRLTGQISASVSKARVIDFSIDTRYIDRYFVVPA